MIYLIFLNVQLSLEGQLSRLRILEAEVENFENSNSMLDDDGVKQGKKRLPRQTMLAETFSWKWAKDW